MHKDLLQYYAVSIIIHISCFLSKTWDSDVYHQLSPITQPPFYSLLQCSQPITSPYNRHFSQSYFQQLPCEWTSFYHSSLHQSPPRFHLGTGEGNPGNRLFLQSFWMSLLWGPHTWCIGYDGWRDFSGSPLQTKPNPVALQCICETENKCDFTIYNVHCMWCMPLVKINWLKVLIIIISIKCYLIFSYYIFSKRLKFFPSASWV